VVPAVQAPGVSSGHRPDNAALQAAEQVDRRWTQAVGLGSGNATRWAAGEVILLCGSTKGVV